MMPAKGLLPRVISLIPVAHGEVTRTKNFIPDYTYTSQFLDLWSFDEVTIVNVGRGFDAEWLKYSSFVGNLLETCFLPVTLGGGLTSIDQVAKCMDLGADRVLIGSAAIEDPAFVEAVAQRWGAQAVIVGLAMRWFNGELGAVRSRQTDRLAMPALELVERMHDAGAGEFLINSVDRDGSLSGPDHEAAKLVSENIKIPFVIAGGVGNWRHVAQGIAELGAQGVATSNIYHLTSDSVSAAKRYLAEEGIQVRLGDDDGKDLS